jgi:hypothetical protein
MPQKANTIRAIQVDGGSEFRVAFEVERQRRNIKLFVLSPRSLRLNQCVARRTHTEEFYEVARSSFDIAELRGELLEWEQLYDAIRPRQTLSYLIPLNFPEQWKETQRKMVKRH